MRKREAITILDEHAEGLKQGVDLSADLLAGRPEAAADLEPLLRIAAAVKEALLPVPAPAPYKTRLGQELAVANLPVVTIKAGRLPATMVLLVVAVAGSLLSAAGLILWLLRRLRPALDGLESRPAAAPDRDAALTGDFLPADEQVAQPLPAVA